MTDLRDYRIWDLHCHLSGVPGRTPHERMAELLRYADRLGLERLIIFMGMSFTQDPSPARLRQENDEALEALSHWHDRALGFCYVSPRHVAESLAEMERCIANGPMVGIKLWVAQRCRDRAIDPIIEKAAQLKAAIFQHTWFKSNGNFPGESTPLDLAELAKRHPHTPIICGHTGGDWEQGIRAVRDLPNVSIDVAGSDPTAGFVEMAVRELGAERILYGSDVAGRSFSSQVAKVLDAQIPADAKRLIFGANLRKLLAPILQQKGISLEVQKKP